MDRPAGAEVVLPPMLTLALQSVMMEGNDERSSEASSHEAAGWRIDLICMTEGIRLRLREICRVTTHHRKRPQAADACQRANRAAKGLPEAVAQGAALYKIRRAFTENGRLEHVAVLGVGVAANRQRLTRDCNTPIYPSLTGSQRAGRATGCRTTEQDADSRLVSGNEQT